MPPKTTPITNTKKKKNVAPTGVKLNSRKPKMSDVTDGSCLIIEWPAPAQFSVATDSTDIKECVPQFRGDSRSLPEMS